MGTHDEGRIADRPRTGKLIIVIHLIDFGYAAYVPLNLNQLRVLEALGRTGSFTRAAGLLFVTQPAVTAQIRQLEQQCGTKLFERLRRSAQLTPAGETLFRYAQRIFALAAEAEQSLELARQLKTGRLRLVASLTAAAYYLPDLMTAFHERNPGIQLQLTAANSLTVAQRIRDFVDDLGVLSSSADDPNLVLTPLCEDPVVLIVPPRHRWARKRSLSIHTLEGQPLVLREPGSGTRALIESCLTKHRVTVRPLMELASNEAIKRTVERGNALALISAAVVQREAHAHRLAIVRIREPGLLRRYSLVYHRERRESPVLRAMLAVCETIRPPRSRAPVGTPRQATRERVNSGQNATRRP